MQFSGAKGIALFVVLLVGVCGVGFASGVLVGRQHPRHHFQPMGETKFVLDSTTGRVCNPFQDPSVSTNVFDHAFDPPPKDANGFPLALPPSYPPACGK